MTTQRLPPIDSYDSFIGREYIRAHFEQMLSDATSDRWRLMTIKGNSGTGKTTLIDYLRVRICAPAGWSSMLLDFSLPTYRAILENIEDVLKNCVSSEARTRYLSNPLDIFDLQQPPVTVNMSIDAQNGSNVTAAQDVEMSQIAHKRELEHRARLTNALVRLAAEMEKPLCLFIDRYERLHESSAELLTWFWEELILRLANASRQPVVTVTCGWETPSLSSLAPYIEAMPPLEDFQRDEVKRYLEKQAVFLEDQQEELIDAFYELTRGHPMVLSLAVTYFQELVPQEQTLESLYSPNVLEDTNAQAKFIHGRLLSQLVFPPYRTLLQYGPVLRTFDQRALQVLLQAVLAYNQPLALPELAQTETDDEPEPASDQEATDDEPEPVVPVLDDEAYDRFLRYPFITRGDDPSRRGQRAFHDLIREIQLDSLRTHHRPIVQHLHAAMADYYIEIASEEMDAATETPSLIDFTLPERAFHAYVESVYHAFQVPEACEECFQVWHLLTQAIVHTHCEQADRLIDKVRQYGQKSGQGEALLAVVTQLIAERNEFFQKDSRYYGNYIMLYSRFLDQEGNWQKEQEKLEEAIAVFTRAGESSSRALCVNNLGLLYLNRGNLMEAVRLLEEALAELRETDSPESIALLLNNLSVVYQSMGLDDQADHCLREAISLTGRMRDPTNLVLAFNNQGVSHQRMGNLGEAEMYFKRALTTASGFDIFQIPVIMKNIGSVLQQRGKLDYALDYYKHALSASLELGNIVNIALIQAHIGGIYELQGKWQQALEHYKQAFTHYERSENIPDTIVVLGKISKLYIDLDQEDEALSHLENLCALCEQHQNQPRLAIALALMGELHRRQGRIEEALKVFHHALPLFDDEKPSLEMKANSLAILGQVAREQQQWPLALDYLAQSVQLAQRLHNSDLTLSGLREMGQIYLQRQEWALASQCYEQQIKVLQEKPQDAAEMLSVLHTLGMIACQRRIWRQAFAYYERALRLSEYDAVQKALTLSLLGDYFCARGSWDLALRYHKWALAIRHQLLLPEYLLPSLNRLAFVYSARENWPEAQRSYKQALVFGASAASFFSAMSGISYVRGHLDQAYQSCEQALKLRQGEGEPVDEDEMATLALLNNKGEISRARADLPHALALHQQTLAAYQRVDYAPGLAISLNNLAGYYLAQGEHTEALESLKRSEAACNDALNLSILAVCLNNMSTLYFSQGQPKRARRDALRALKICENLGLLSLTALVSHHLALMDQEEQPAEALKHLERALAFYQRLGHVTDQIALQELELAVACAARIPEPGQVAHYQARAHYARTNLPTSATELPQPRIFVQIPEKNTPFSPTSEQIPPVYFIWLNVLFYSPSA